MADPSAIGNEFAKFYYQTFDESRDKLSSLYRPESMLTFEGQPFQGAQAICEKLVSLPFKRVQHRVLTTDVQPSNPQSNSLLIFVTGQLLIDEETKPQFFSQVFQLFADPSGNWFVYNDLFRLNYG